VWIDSYELNVTSIYLLFCQGVNLVADIGGQLGLWIGISVLTCCEFVELVVMIVQTALDRISRRKIIHVQP